MEDCEYEREFRGVWIPREIWLSKDLTLLEKCIYTEINSLDTDEMGCYASNKYLSEFCQCSERKVTEAITKLKELGYIHIENFNGRTRILKINQDSQKILGRVEKNSRQGRKICYAEPKNLRPINIEDKINNNINYIKENIKESENPQKEIVDYLNEKANTNYKYTSQKTISLIKARMNEGFTVDDFKKAIDNKVFDWKDTEYEQYLRPETLFGTKFESYLNRVNRRGKNGKPICECYNTGTDDFYDPECVL